MFVHLNDLIKDGVCRGTAVDQVQHKCDDEHNRGGLADTQYVFLQFTLREVFMQDRDGLALQSGVKGAWDEKTKGSHEQQSAADFGYNGGELLVLVMSPNPSREEAKAETEKKVSQDGAQDSGL
jgi:hypothetical protein